MSKVQDFPICYSSTSPSITGRHQASYAKNFFHSCQTYKAQCGLVGLIKKIICLHVYAEQKSLVASKERIT